MIFPTHHTRTARTFLHYMQRDPEYTDAYLEYHAGSQTHAVLTQVLPTRWCRPSAQQGCHWRPAAPGWAHWAAACARAPHAPAGPAGTLRWRASWPRLPRMLRATDMAIIPWFIVTQ